MRGADRKSSTIAVRMILAHSGFFENIPDLLAGAYRFYANRNRWAYKDVSVRYEPSISVFL